MQKLIEISSILLVVSMLWLVADSVKDAGSIQRNVASIIISNQGGN